MNIAKIINNNVISVFNNHHEELVIMGRGIGFQKRPGDVVDEEKIEKTFVLKNNDVSEKFKSLLDEVPVEYLEASEEIISYAKTKIGRELNDIIYVTLTDHIHFAIQRHKKGLDIRNALLLEIKRLYRDEFSIGKEAINKIFQKFGVTLPEDEAGFIAMHIVNAELNEEMPTIVNITKVIHDVLNIVKYHFKVTFDEESLNYYRFVTHLKFFAQRLLSGSFMEKKEDYLFEVVKKMNQEAFECTEKINEYIKKQYGHDLTNEEMLYLTIHIERVVQRS